MDALVIGGTGPTGPFIVKGLLAREYSVTVLNRGTHDTPDIPESVERIKGDPHFKETLAEALEGRSFDLVVATYGRIRYVAEVIAAHTNRLITVGGSPGIKGSRQPENVFPAGARAPLPDDAPRIETPEEFHFGYLARISEDAVMAHNQSGDYQGTHLRYPIIYGPRQLRPPEWFVIRRILDGRDYIVLPDSGLSMITRGYSENMAAAVLCAVDNPAISAGQIYNCGDVHQLTLAQWVEVIADAMGGSLRVHSVPGPLAYSARDLMISRRTSHHQLFDMHKIRAELGYEDKVPVLEALASTVRYYKSSPPEETDEMKANLAAHYATEDEMVKIVERLSTELEAVPHIDPDYRHPYAHPKKPGDKDHHGR